MHRKELQKYCYALMVQSLRCLAASASSARPPPSIASISPRDTLPFNPPLPQHMSTSEYKTKGRATSASCEQLPVLEARGLPLPVHEARGHRAWPLGYNLPVLLPSFKVVLHLPRPCAFAPLHLIICTSAACPCNNSSLLPTLLCRQHSQHLSNPTDTLSSSSSPVYTPAMAAGDKKWDAAAERDLCVAIIMGNQEGRTNYNWPKVHAFLTKLGYKFTKDAISQHFTKVVMKDFKTRHGDDPIKSGASTPKKPSTPRRAAASTPSKRKTPTSAKAKAAAKSAEFVSAEDDDETSDEEPLAKKRKVKAEAAAAEAEAEAETMPSPVKKETRKTRARSQTVCSENEAFQAWLEKTGS
ncbi:hypothetical protein PCL_09260 [Purpureocillium lilacinum]|uniref:Uncharacterized protein n=3 Tax=Purpureocillium lilacinum TaxID=33203 RepID=A0A2U3EHJ7_PURLI|nr:hypothetical protein PCL_09260 [Purpureocillium lilacinum]